MRTIGRGRESEKGCFLLVRTYSTLLGHGMAVGVRACVSCVRLRVLVMVARPMRESALPTYVTDGTVPRGQCSARRSCARHRDVARGRGVLLVAPWRRPYSGVRLLVLLQGLNAPLHMVQMQELFILHARGALAHLKQATRLTAARAC